MRDILGHSGTSRAGSDLNGAKTLNQRLDSWKEIASFFRRDERTVKRWEKERGLPVHRLQDSATGRVYAYSDELLRWMKSPVSAEPVASTVEAAEADLDASAVEVPQAAALTQAAPAQGEVNLRRRASDKVRPARWGRLFGAFALAALLVVAGGFLYLKRLAWRAGRPDVSAGKSFAAGHTTNPEARDFYLKGRYEWDKRTPESLNQAVDYFTQAIVHDPNYAQAYVGLADCYNLLREFSAMPPEEAYPRALAAAKKAVELDDSSADAHTSLAFATFYGNFDAAGAEREFRRALALNPSDAQAHHWYAKSLFAEGRYAEDLVQI
ncbi:MAG: tetratricopeptide repeat protein [Terriglobales bacterium]